MDFKVYFMVQFIFKETNTSRVIEIQANTSSTQAKMEIRNSK